MSNKKKKNKKYSNNSSREEIDYETKEFKLTPGKSQNAE